MPERKVIVEQTVARFDPLTNATQHFHRVYVWAERPDKEAHTPTDQWHWQFDSEHRTEHLAAKRAEQLKAGSTEPGPTVQSLPRKPGDVGAPELGRPKLTLHLGDKRTA